jgi:hypothetical protein
LERVPVPQASDGTDYKIVKAIARLYCVANHSSTRTLIASDINGITECKTLRYTLGTEKMKIVGAESQC